MRVYLDTAPVIYTVEQIPLYAAAVDAQLSAHGVVRVASDLTRMGGLARVGWVEAIAETHHNPRRRMMDFALLYPSNSDNGGKRMEECGLPVKHGYITRVAD